VARTREGDNKTNRREPRHKTKAGTPTGQPVGWTINLSWFSPLGSVATALSTSSPHTPQTHRTRSNKTTHRHRR